MKIIDEDSVKYLGLNGKSDEYREGYFEAMAAHDDAPTVINSIIKLRPKKEDFIVVSYATQSLTTDNMWNIHKMIRDSFPDNKVIGVPDTVNIRCCDEHVLERYIDNIRNAIRDKSN